MNMQKYVANNFGLYLRNTFNIFSDLAEMLMLALLLQNVQVKPFKHCMKVAMLFVLALLG